MSLGFSMAVSHHLAPQLLHPQLMLAGLGLTLVYGVIHQLWLATLPHSEFAPSLVQTLCQIQQSGTLTMFTALLLSFGNLFFNIEDEPAYVFASLVMLTGLISFLYSCRRTVKQEVNL